jgi:hypothetical protein
LRFSVPGPSHHFATCLETEVVLVKLLDDAVDVWRPVDAEVLPNGLHRLPQPSRSTRRGRFLPDPLSVVSIKPWASLPSKPFPRSNRQQHIANVSRSADSLLPAGVGPYWPRALAS